MIIPDIPLPLPKQLWTQPTLNARRRRKRLRRNADTHDDDSPPSPSIAAPPSTPTPTTSTLSITNYPQPPPSATKAAKAPGGPPPGPQGFFDSDPPAPPPRPPPASSQACLSPGSTVTYIDANGTTHNYTNLGGNCLGLDVGEAGSQISNVTITSGQMSLHDPFFASVTPQTFALAGATIATAILLIMLFLSRTRKPWIQKLATFSMTVSLVTYMVVSVEMLQEQYLEGRYDADALRGVNQIMVCKVFAYIAELMIYLAQVQTLMRIFPRKRDKVIIKWTGLALILLTMLFCGLFNFLQPSAPPPGQRSTAWQIFLQILSPLNYLFSIALATIYALCVMYFGIVHRRVAFTIPAGFILACLSLACITMPIIFFCLDIWAEFVVGWGQYIRSIASIGSAVIVWEWIERVDEAEMKRDGKSGVLGRRIFEDEFDSTTKLSSSSESSGGWRDWGKKIRVPSLISGISDKASEWSLKLQSKLDRRVSTPSPPPLNELALSDLNASTSLQSGAVTTPSASDETRTTTTGDDAFTATTYTQTSAVSSSSPLVSGKRPKKKHHYPIARSANRTRQLTLTPSSTQSPPLASTSLRTEVFDPSSSTVPVTRRSEDGERPESSNAPSFRSRESDDPRARFSTLPGFTAGDYFLDPADMEKRGWTEDERIS